MEELKKELQTIYPEATIIDIHNMIQDLTDFCLACANATIQGKQKQVANDNEKNPRKKFANCALCPTKKKKGQPKGWPF